MSDLDWPDDQPTLDSGRVVLRPWRLEDRDDVLAACQDPEIQRWTTVPSPYTAQDAAFFVEIVAALWEARAGAPFAVTAPGDQRVHGSVGIVALDPATGHAEVGYWIAPWARGQGMATAAVRGLTGWALDEVGFRVLDLVIDPRNTASCAVAAAAGYELTAVDSDHRLRKPDPGETAVYRRRSSTPGTSPTRR